MLNAEISDRWEPFVQSQVASGKFPSTDAVIDEALRLLSERAQRVDPASSSTPGPASHPPAWLEILDLIESVPDSAFDQVPIDSSAQLDHYLYGTPKRPAP